MANKATIIKSYREHDGYRVHLWKKPTTTGGTINGTTVESRDGFRIEFAATLSRKDAIHQAKHHQKTRV